MKTFYLICGSFIVAKAYCQGEPLNPIKIGQTVPDASPVGNLGSFRFGQDYIQAYVRVVNMPQRKDTRSVLLTITTLNKTPLDFKVAIEPKQNQKFSSFGEFLVIPAVALNGKMPLRITGELRTKKNISQEFGLIQGLLTTATNVFTGGALSTISTLNRYSSATVDIVRDCETRTEVADTNQIIVFDDSLEPYLRFEDNYVFTFTNGKPTIDAWDKEGKPVEIQEKMITNVENINRLDEAQYKAGTRIPRFKLTYRLRAGKSGPIIPTTVPSAQAIWKQTLAGTGLDDKQISEISSDLVNLKGLLPKLNSAGVHTDPSIWRDALKGSKINGSALDTLIGSLRFYSPTKAAGIGFPESSLAGGQGSPGSGFGGGFVGSGPSDETAVAYCDESQPFIIVTLKRYARYPNIRSQIHQIEQIRENLDAIFYPATETPTEDALYALIISETKKMATKLRVLTDAGDLSLWDASQILTEVCNQTRTLISDGTKRSKIALFTQRLSRDFWSEEGSNTTNGI